MQRKVIAVIKREYLTRVKTKGFIASVALTPLLMLIVTLLPSLMMRMQYTPEKIETVHISEKIKTVVVFDDTSEIFPKMEAAIDADPVLRYNENRGYRLVERESNFNGNLEAKKELNQQLQNREIEAYLEIPKDVLEHGQVEYYAKTTTNFDQLNTFKQILSNIVTDMRFEKKGYSGTEIRSLMRGVHLNILTVEATGKNDNEADKVEDETATWVKRGLGFGLGILLYMFTITYATFVMRSVLEEKTTRIVEVIISSIEPYQLLLGKLIGVCSVCLTMFAIWVFFGVVLAMNLNPILRTFGVDAPPEQINQIIHIIKANSGPTLFYFVIYFVSGFLLYSIVYAAIGAICNSSEEAQQASTPVAMMFIIPMILGPSQILTAPDSPLNIALSHFPFFSPFFMFMRINTLTPPLWEILLNIAAMVIAAVVAILILGKIYRIGILMYGKRPSLAELWRWLRY